MFHPFIHSIPGHCYQNRQEGLSALMVAARHNQLTCAQVLLRAGAKLTLPVPVTSRQRMSDIGIEFLLQSVSSESLLICRASYIICMFQNAEPASKFKSLSALQFSSPGATRHFLTNNVQTHSGFISLVNIEKSALLIVHAIPFISINGITKRLSNHPIRH